MIPVPSHPQKVGSGRGNEPHPGLDALPSLLASLAPADLLSLIESIGKNNTGLWKAGQECLFHFSAAIRPGYRGDTQTGAEFPRIETVQEAYVFPGFRD